MLATSKPRQAWQFQLKLRQVCCALSGPHAQDNVCTFQYAAGPGLLTAWLHACGAGQAGPAEGRYQVIYKRGDDLRQDQVVVQIFSLMDRLLKRENLDLKLTAYR